ncbi:hypothetical protein Hanom_Chr00s022473g01761631 [Helianthus anomalus]
MKPVHEQGYPARSPLPLQPLPFVLLVILASEENLLLPLLLTRPPAVPMVGTDPHPASKLFTRHTYI